MKSWIVLLGVFFFFGTAKSQTKTRVLFILDASNSMNVTWGSETRIQAARDVLSQEVESMRGFKNLEIALRVYGHQSTVTNSFQDCNDTKLEVPFGNDNFTIIKDKIKNIQAKGATPIARSLEASANDFPDTLARNYIILITDGLESCDNDPCIIAKKLKEKGVKVTPFVIGLGLDLSYLNQFSCIGTFSEAENKQAFKKVLDNIVQQVVLRTTAQINLNDSKGKPKETDVTVVLKEAGTEKIKYTFMHTLNRWGNPDTVFIDPNLRYDAQVYTIPPVTKKGITLVPNTHNIIPIDVPQGFIRVKSTQTLGTQPIEVRVSKSQEKQTLHHQRVNDINKFLVGKYDLEILTMPRMYRTVTVNPLEISEIEIPAPGTLVVTSSKPVVAQLFYESYPSEWTWIYNFPTDMTQGEIALLPGNYKIVYRTKERKSTAYTTVNNTQIKENKTTQIQLQ
ncbi:MAG: vWA domain-containing protein [Flavobacteriales bacterium]